MKLLEQAHLARHLDANFIKNLVNNGVLLFLVTGFIQDRIECVFNCVQKKKAGVSYQKLTSAYNLLAAAHVQNFTAIEQTFNFLLKGYKGATLNQFGVVNCSFINSSFHSFGKTRLTTNEEN